MFLRKKAYYGHQGRNGNRGGSTKRQFGIGGQRLPKPDPYNPVSVDAFDFQKQICGGIEYELHGSKKDGTVQKIWADGIKPEPPSKPEKVIEVKYIGNSKKSPYVPGSLCDEKKRQEVMIAMRSEFERYATVLNDSRNGLKGFEVVTNEPKSKPMWEALMNEFGIKGTVVITEYNDGDE